MSVHDDQWIDVEAAQLLLRAPSLQAVRHLAHRYQWRRKRDGRRSLYNLADVLDTPYRRADA